MSNIERMYKPSEKEVPGNECQIVQLLLNFNFPYVLRQIYDKADDVLFTVTYSWQNLQRR